MMNGFRPTIGIEFEDKYTEAKNKLIDFIKAFDKLTPLQREQLAREYLACIGKEAAFEQFIHFMNNGGKA